MSTYKPWHQSLTVWLNVISLAVLVAGYLADNALSLGIPPAVTGYALLVVTAGNAVLRLFATSMPLSIGENIPATGQKIGQVKIVDSTVPPAT